MDILIIAESEVLAFPVFSCCWNIKCFIVLISTITHPPFLVMVSAPSPLGPNNMYVILTVFLMNCAGKKWYIWITHVLNLHTLIMINSKHWKMFALSSMTMFKNFIQNIDIDISHFPEGGKWLNYYPLPPRILLQGIVNCMSKQWPAGEVEGRICETKIWIFIIKKRVIYLKGYSYLSLENLDEKVFYID